MKTTEICVRFVLICSNTVANDVKVIYLLYVVQSNYGRCKLYSIYEMKYLVINTDLKCNRHFIVNEIKKKTRTIHFLRIEVQKDQSGTGFDKLFSPEYLTEIVSKIMNIKIKINKFTFENSFTFRS